MRATRLIFILSVLCFIVVPWFVSAQTIPEEARRHMARGQAAVEIAKTPDEYGPAIKEVQEASRLAPGWPAPWYNLALLQEKAGKLKEAVASLKEYLRLAPNAPDAATIQDHIYKLAYKAEQALTVPEIIDVLVSFRGWDANPVRGWSCRTSRKAFYYITHQGNAAANVPAFIFPGITRGEYEVPRSQVMEIKGPLLKYVTIFNACDLSVVYDNHGTWPDHCFNKLENEIKVVSRTPVIVTQRQLDRGSGVTTCTFQKK